MKSVDAAIAEAVRAELRDLLPAALTTALSEVRAEEGPRLLDRDGLAKALGTSTRSVDRLRRDGMPELKVGDAPRFEFAEVVAWLRARRGGLRLVGGSRG